MDAVIALLPHVRFGHIEKMYAGGFCFRVVIDPVRLSRVILKTEKARTIVTEHFSRYNHSIVAEQISQVIILEQFSPLFGPDGERWKFVARNGVLHCYFKERDDLYVAAERFGSSFVDVLFPRSAEVLAELARPTRMKEAKAIYRKTLFWGKYRWRVSLKRAPNLNEVDPDYEAIRAALATGIEPVDYALEDERVYFRNETDLIFLRMGFTHCIKKIEKVILQEDFNASDVASQTR